MEGRSSHYNSCSYNANLQKGSAIVVALVSLAFLTIILMASGYSLSYLHRINKAIEVHNALSTLQTNIMSEIIGGQTWSNLEYEIKTSLKNELFQNSEPCAGYIENCRIYSGKLRLIRADGTEFYSSILSNSGFEPNSEPCFSFSSGGNLTCIFRVELDWRAFCPPLKIAACESPEVMIQASFMYSPAQMGFRSLVNATKYSFKFYKQL